jgi:hypothetical protein
VAEEARDKEDQQEADFVDLAAVALDGQAGGEFAAGRRGLL